MRSFAIYDILLCHRARELTICRQLRFWIRRLLFRRAEHDILAIRQRASAIRSPLPTACASMRQGHGIADDERDRCAAYENTPRTTRIRTAPLLRSSRLVEEIVILAFLLLSRAADYFCQRR